MYDDFMAGPDDMDDHDEEWDIEPDEYLQNDLDNTDDGFGENDHEDHQYKPDALLDNVDALILGSMIFGNAYDEGLAEKMMKKRKRKNGK